MVARGPSGRCDLRGSLLAEVVALSGILRLTFTQRPERPPRIADGLPVRGEDVQERRWSCCDRIGSWSVGLAVLVVGLGGCRLESDSRSGDNYDSPFTRQKLDKQYEPYGYVAHALGAADGVIYTNSLQAFLTSYRQGFRLFEVDLVLLGDGSVLAAHNNLERYYNLDKPFSEARAGEVSRKFKGRFTVLFERDLLRLFAEYPDTYLIADTKGDAVEDDLRIISRLVEVGLRFHPEVLERVIPHVSGQSHLDQLREIYPFNDFMLALYRARMKNARVLDFLRKNEVRAVMMRWNRRYSRRFDSQLRQAGVVTFVHSLSKNQLEHLLRFRELRVGVYSNGVFLTDGGIPRELSESQGSSSG